MLDERLSNVAFLLKHSPLNDNLRLDQHLPVHFVDTRSPRKNRLTLHLVELFLKLTVHRW